MLISQTILETIKIEIHELMEYVIVVHQDINGVTIQRLAVRYLKQVQILALIIMDLSMSRLEAL